MPDNLSPEDRKKTMRAVKGKGTNLERQLFAMLAGMELKGWRKNAADISGKPDVIFVEEKVAIFVDGCFWHGCQDCKRKLPESNRAYWEQKINRNKERDVRIGESLVAAGWVVVRVWEHEISDVEVRAVVRRRISAAVFARRNTTE